MLFSGGRGSGVLSTRLLRDPRIQLTLAINGYDDGASTGEVRRFLGDSLGPSDFRKNASRLALELGTCDPALVRRLDERLPSGLSTGDAIAHLRRTAHEAPVLASRLNAFFGELEASGRPFDFNDCSVGNLVFAGSFLLSGRRFNQAIDDYCGLVGLAPGVVDNVTDGTNAYLVAIAADGSVLASEEAIVDATRRNHITDIFLIDHAPTEDERRRLAEAGADQARRIFERHQMAPALNPRVAERIRAADLIVYAPGTQHSSLFPSYLTPGLNDAIALNLRAMKLLITNIQADAEIADASAVDIIDRAVYYLTDRGSRSIPTPFLITHYLVNDPEHTEPSAPYVPLGQIDTLEDPRVVRIANYEDGVSGRHDAGRILGPLIESLLEPPRVQRAVVFLHATATPELTERLKGEILRVACEHGFAAPQVFAGEADLRRVIGAGQVDYVILFDASGAYSPGDVGALLSHLGSGRLDAVWGSRRFWARNIRESIRARYGRKLILRTVSHVGSHLLSLACLVRYGRYVSDCLSGVRAVRVNDVLAITVPLSDTLVNQHLLNELLGRKADVLEIPVQFSVPPGGGGPGIGIGDGLRALVRLLTGRPRATRQSTTNSKAEVDTVDDRRTGPAPSR